MKSVDMIQGQMMPLPRANVDTDQIIPKQFLKRVERSGFGPFLFYDWVYDEEGEVIADFILNHPAYQDASVLVSGPNFGSGSSRTPSDQPLPLNGTLLLAIASTTPGKLRIASRSAAICAS